MVFFFLRFRLLIFLLSKASLLVVDLLRLTDSLRSSLFTFFVFLHRFWQAERQLHMPASLEHSFDSFVDFLGFSKFWNL